MVTRRFIIGQGFTASLLVPAALRAAPLVQTAASAQPVTHGGIAPDTAHPRPATRQVVVLDPGHGGKDPGAIGSAGSYEKHIALAAAQELRRQLEAGGHYSVVMTRARDYFIPLEERVAIAERARAALFVSLHADAMANRDVRGASVYTLADAPSDADTAALARRENAAAGQPRGEVGRILASLARQETRAGSARMAHRVVACVGEAVPMLPHPSRHADFIVLQASNIPSVLLEMGFLSNRTDELALRRAEHRRLVASAMKRAIDAWFASREIPGGLVG